MAHLLEQWSIFEARLAGNRNLLGSQRRRCFSLLGKTRESVLRDDPVATKWLRAQIGVMLGQDGSLEDVAGFLGERPPEWMEQEEFDIRVKILADSVPTRAEAFEQLRSHVAEAIAELKEHQTAIQKMARRRLRNKAIGAGVNKTPEGTRLTNYISANDRGCDAALRRLEIQQKPVRGPGPGSGSGGSAKSEIRNPKPTRIADEESPGCPEASAPMTPARGRCGGGSGHRGDRGRSGRGPGGNP